MRCNKTKQNKFTKLIVLFKLFKLESCNLKKKKKFRSSIYDGESI